MAEQKESSVLFSLKELMSLEEDRIKQEEDDRKRKEQAEQQARLDAERRAREEEVERFLQRVYADAHPSAAGRCDMWRRSCPTVDLSSFRCTTESSMPWSRRNSLV